MRNRDTTGRLARILRQALLPVRYDLHRTFIGSVERGQRNVSVLNLRLIARALRVPLKDLFDESRRQQNEPGRRPRPAR